ncbi:protein of unknown function [Modestobacter italicus]|uniref:Uncharacterized protein n=1 Tax=Modestobacter italicus (strain DSM 44449 / CECT 9708 / BC 501) TaxID=2732864 RepID=I4EVD8_MODI5|nr:hypothetical protein [Modestobacter marinus]CCH87351.1 protein of unknown function [Modestobacter marinus]
MIDDVFHDRGGCPEDGVLAGRRAHMDHLRRVAVLMETAAVLDRRASRTANAAYAGVLRERATARRQTAELLRAGLLVPGRPAAG